MPEEVQATTLVADAAGGAPRLAYRGSRASYACRGCTSKGASSSGAGGPRGEGRGRATAYRMSRWTRSAATQPLHTFSSRYGRGQARGPAPLTRRGCFLPVYRGGCRGYSAPPPPHSACKLQPHACCTQPAPAPPARSDQCNACNQPRAAL